MRDTIIDILRSTGGVDRDELAYQLQQRGEKLVDADLWQLIEDGLVKDEKGDFSLASHARETAPASSAGAKPRVGRRKITRRFSDRPCEGCREDFTPTGARQRFCASCGTASKRNAKKPEPAPKPAARPAPRQRKAPAKAPAAVVVAERNGTEEKPPPLRSGSVSRCAGSPRHDQGPGRGSARSARGGCRLPRSAARAIGGGATTHTPPSLVRRPGFPPVGFDWIPHAVGCFRYLFVVGELRRLV